jgi:hypothetical protein
MRKPLKMLAQDPKTRSAWDSTVYFQISQSICGRGIRTRDWCYWGGVRKRTIEYAKTDLVYGGV